MIVQPLNSETTASTTVASISPPPVQSYPAPQYSVLTGLYSFSLALVIMTVFGFLVLRQDRKSHSNQAILLLQRQATLERLYRTHYWSEDYRTQNASEDRRSGSLSDRANYPQTMCNPSNSPR